MIDITKENIILENERVLLRPLAVEDMRFLLPFSLNEADIFKYSLISPGGGKEALADYITVTHLQKELGKEYAFIVFDKKAGQYAGSTRFYDIQVMHQTTQLGYTWYGKNFQRSGLNRHCKLLLLEFAFEKWGMERVELRADARNARSIQAMKDIGCTEEGLLRSNLALPHEPGLRRDTIVLSILKEEWVAKVKDHLISRIHP